MIITDDMFNKNTLNIEHDWKQSMLILLALFPAVMLETLYLFPHLTSLNPVLARFLGVIIIVLSLSWVLMPQILYLFKWWLNSDSTRQEYTGLFIVLGLYLMEICFFLLIS